MQENLTEGDAGGWRRSLNVSQEVYIIHSSLGPPHSYSREKNVDLRKDKVYYFVRVNFATFNINILLSF